MVKFYDSIQPDLAEWILKQPLFYVASAPLNGAHVNVSPKGHPSRTFAILHPNQVAYLDNTGSGIETVAHVYENGRVTVMFCGFGRAPRILRLFCRGRVVERCGGDDDDGGEFQRWIRKMEGVGMVVERRKKKMKKMKKRGEKEGGGKRSGSRGKEEEDDDDDVDEDAFDDGRKRGKDSLQGVRAVVVLDVWKVQTSCGFGVPVMASTVAGEKEEDVQPQVHPGTGINLLSDYPSSARMGGRKSVPAGEDEERGLVSTKAEKYWEDRDTMSSWAAKMVERKKLEEYRVLNNARSLDGLPGLKAARREKGEKLWVGDLAAWMRRVGGQWEAVLLGMLIAFLSVYVLTQLGVSL